MWLPGSSQPQAVIFRKEIILVKLSTSYYHYPNKYRKVHKSPLIRIPWTCNSVLHFNMTIFSYIYRCIRNSKGREKEEGGESYFKSIRLWEFGMTRKLPWFWLQSNTKYIRSMPRRSNRAAKTNFSKRKKKNDIFMISRHLNVWTSVRNMSERTISTIGERKYLIYKNSKGLKDEMVKDFFKWY